MFGHKISVIVPVYNSKDYLDECVESILTQTYKNLELILVDDGSTDESLEVCRRWERLDSRVRAIHQENAGPGAARNTGIDNATGDYLAFVDSDDTVKSNAYERMLSLASENNADIVCSSVFETAEAPCVEIFSREEALSARMEKHTISDSSCDKIYRKTVFNGLRYPVERSLSEDSALIYRLLASAKTVVRTSENFYVIRATDSSLSRRKYHAGVRYTINTYEEMVDFFKKSGEDRYERIAQQYAAGAVFYNAGECYCSGFKDKAQILFIKEHAKMQRRQYDKLSRKNKLLLFLVAYFWSVFGILYKIKK